MRYLNKKFGKDILQLWPQFISVIMMAVLSVAIYCGMSAVWTGMEQSYAEYKNETGLADAYISGAHITEEQTAMFRSLYYVSEAEGSMLIKYNTEIDGEQSDIYVNSFKEDTKKLLNPLLIRGEKLSENKKGIWLDEDYAKAHDLNPGDKITVAWKETKKELEILGTVLDAENIYFVTSYSETVPDHNSHGYGYMSEKSAEDITGGVIYNQIRLRLSESYISKETLRKDGRHILGRAFLALDMKEDRASIVQVEDEISQIKKMAVLFSAVFILLSILSIYTTMSRLISNQIVQIGTLKSLGFYDRHIYLHYGLYGFSVAVFGSALGALIGYTVVADLVTGIKKATVTLPTWNKVAGPDSFILIFLIIAVCTSAAVITTRNAVKNNPSLTIRGVTDKRSDILKKQKRTKLSYELLWTMRSMKMHPVRALMSVIAIIGSVVLMVAGIGVWDSLYNSYEQVYDEEFRYEYIGQIYGADYAEISKGFEQYNVQFARIEPAEISRYLTVRDGVLSVMDSGSLIRLYDAETKKEINLEQEEAVISSQMAEKLSVGVGSHIEYKIKNSPRMSFVTVTAVADAKMPQGIFIHKDRLERFEPNTIYMGDKEAYDRAAKEKTISNIMPITKQKESMKEMMDSVHSIMYILILASFVLSAVILYNLGVLSCLERYREYATMKVIGFYNREINRLVLKESIFNLFGGLIVGIPLSKLFLKLYIRVVSMDSMEWKPLITTGHFFAVIAGVVGFSMLINLIVFSRIRKVDMIESLKSVE